MIRSQNVYTRTRTRIKEISERKLVHDKRLTLTCEGRMDMWWRVRRSAGGIRTGTAVVSRAQQLFGAALVLIRRLGGQALSRVFPLCRSR